MSEGTLELSELFQQNLEANRTLEEEVQRLRKTATMLRGVNTALRRANESLRRQAELAVENDELFKHICNTGFGAPVASEEGGLPDNGVVEIPAIDGVEASRATTFS